MEHNTACPFKAECSFFTDYKAMALLDQSQTWQLQWFLLLETQGPVLQARPWQVPIQASAKPVVQFWPLTREGGRGVQRQVPAPLSPDSDDWGMVQAGVQALGPGPQNDVDEAVEDLPVAPLLDEVSGNLLDRALAENVVEDAELHVALEMLPDLGTAGEQPPSANEPAPAEMADQPGPAAGSGEAAPATAPLPPEAPPPAARPSKSKAYGEVFLEHGGRIAYHLSNEAFEAHCDNPAHGHCVMTRTAKGRVSNTGETVAGRPLGFLSAWLQMGRDCPDKANHWSKAAWSANLTHEARVAAREAFKRRAGAELMLAVERPVQEGEPEEPLTLKGLA